MVPKGAAGSTSRRTNTSEWFMWKRRKTSLMKGTVKKRRKRRLGNMANLNRETGNMKNMAIPKGEAMEGSKVEATIITGRRRCQSG